MEVLRVLHGRINETKKKVKSLAFKLLVKPELQARYLNTVLSIEELAS